MITQQIKRNRIQFLFSVLIITIALILLLDVLFVLIPDKDTSSTENRNLQQLPTLTLSNVMDGTFEDDFESYIADQFPFRNQWISLETTISRIMGVQESNGIFLGKNGYLIQDFTEITEENYEKTLKGITDISQINKNIKTRVLVAPTAVSIYKDKLPTGAVTGDENAYLDKLSAGLKDNGITFVDVRKTLNKHVSDQLYYRTDHHWTTEAAYLAYKKYAKKAKLNDGISYTQKLVSDSFKGTLSASSGFRSHTTDDIYVYEPDKSTDYTVRYVSDSTVRSSVYFTENLKKRDQYTLFFNGNYPQIEIDTNVNNNKVLLLFKDSYANCFVPFLIPDYSRIIIVDPRYYTEDIETLIASEDITDILFLYNADTLASDTNIGQLME